VDEYFDSISIEDDHLVIVVEQPPKEHVSGILNEIKRLFLSDTRVEFVNKRRA